MNKIVKRRRRFKPSRIRHLTIDDIRGVVSEVFPSRAGEEGLLHDLRNDISLALHFVRSPVDDIVKLRVAYNRLKKGSPSSSLDHWLLAAAGRHWLMNLKSKDGSAFDNYMWKSGYADFGQAVEAKVEQFEQNAEEIRMWIEKASESVLHDYTPLAESKSFLINQALPRIFEVRFDRRCSNGKTSLGARFIAKVLTKIFEEGKSGAAVLEAVVKARTRYQNQMRAELKSRPSKGMLKSVS